MFLSSLLLTTIARIPNILVNRDNGVSLRNMKFLALSTSIFKTWVLYIIQVYLVKFFTFLLNNYPFLYKAMDYFFTRLSIFNTHLYIIILKLYDKFKNKCPIIYSILLYLYAEYLAIMKGDLSQNIGCILSLYVLYDLNKTNILLFFLLLCNSYFKDYLIRNTSIKINYPILHTITLDISSLINTCFIFYFLDSI